MKREITITVSGVTGSGKSTVATFIAELLANRGIPVEQVQTDDGPLPLAPGDRSLQLSIRMENLRRANEPLKIKIVEQALCREASK